MIKSVRLLLCMILFLFVTNSSALADDSYEITNYSMSVNVHSDGNADVTEMFIYQFDGEYNGVLCYLDCDGLDGIENIHVYVDGQEITPVNQMLYEKNTYTLTQNGSVLELKIYCPGKDNTRLVTCEYQMLGLADKYEDTGVIHRKLIQNYDSVRFQNASLSVRFPRKGTIQAFAHGSMDMEHIQISADSVHFGTVTVYPHDYAEVRLLFPTALIADAPLQEGNVLEQHLSAENHLNAQAYQKAARIKAVKYIFSGVYLLLFLIIWAWLAMKYHLKGMLRKPSNINRLTDFPAAFATIAFDEAPDTDALSGTLLELVQKGLLQMDTPQDDIRFTRLDAECADLYPHQEKLLLWLFERKDSLLISELNAGENSEKAAAFEARYAAYCEQVMTDMITHQLKYQNDGIRITVNALIVLLGVAGVGYISLVGTPSPLLGALMVGLMFALLYLMNRIRTLTNRGEQLQYDAKALKEKVISSEDDIPRLLPYYAALSMTEQLVQAVEERRLNNSVWQEPDYLKGAWHLNVRRLSSMLKSIHHHNASLPSSDTPAPTDGHKLKD